MTTTKKLAVALIILCAAFLAYEGYIYRCIAVSAAEADKKQDEVVARTNNYNGRAILARLPKNEINGYIYRFDERVSEAAVEQAAAVGAGESAPAIDLLKAGYGFKVLRGKLETATDGGFKVTTGGNAFLYTRFAENPMNLKKKDFSKLVVRARNRTGSKLRIYVNEDPVTGGTFATWNSALIELVPDGKFHSYSVGMDQIHVDDIDGVAISPSDVEGDVVEIASIELISRKGAFAGRPAGASNIHKNDEYRQVLFMKSGVGLRYKLNIPASEKPVLSFGLALFDAAEQAELVIETSGPAGKKELFRKRLTDDKGWEDFSVDMAGLCGEQEVTFRTTGRPGGIVFISNPNVAVTQKKKMNIVWYVVDALRADHTSLYGYSRKTTPFLDELAKEGAVFSNAYSQELATGVSCSSYFTGLYPSATGVIDNSYTLPDDYLTIAEVMRAQGFETICVTQNKFAGPFTNLQQGFCRMIVVPDTGRAELGVKTALEQASKSRSRNIFMYVHMFDPHGPYDPLPSSRGWYKENPTAKPLVKEALLDPEWVKTPTAEGRNALYDGEVKYGDDYFKVFVDGMRRDGLYDSTLMLFSADHGEYLGEESLWAHHPPGRSQVQHVPLVMFYPGVIKGDRKIRENVQLLDIMPTLLEYAGINSKTLPMQGDSLVGLLNGGGSSLWRNRLIYSDESDAEAGHENLGSAFFRDYHQLKSIYIKGADAADDPATAKNVGGRPAIVRISQDTLFNRRYDRTELRGFYNPLVGKGLRDSFVGMRARNKQIKANIRKGKTEAAGSDDQEVRGQLKALGYLH